MVDSLGLENEDFIMFYQQTKKGLKKKFLARGLNIQFLDDCLHQSFLELFIKDKLILSDEYSDKQIKAFIIRRACWRMLDQRRKHISMVEYSLEDIVNILDTYSQPEHDNPAYIIERKLIMEERLGDLPPKQQKIVKMILQGWDRKEIAKILQISKAVVDKEFSRAINNLR